VTAILGISAFYHDAAAAVVVDGEVVAACQQERYSRVKNDEDFPVQAIEACLEQAGLPVEDLDWVGFYDKPYLKFDRLLESYLAYAPRGFRSFAESMPLWLQRKLWLPREMRKSLDGWDKPLVFARHHESHAAAAFFPSPFEEATILTVDGVGEWATASFGTGRGNHITLSHELHFPDSLGLLYAAFTSYLGFKVDCDEYKVMGLAPFGEPRFADLIRERIVDIAGDGSFRLDTSFFDYAAGLRMTSEKFHQLFGAAPREPESELTQDHMDLAASIQQVSEEIVLRAARHVHALHPSENLCLSGGVALNCVANGRLLREGPFESIWIQPAAGDAGSALGVALYVWHQLLDEPRVPKPSDSERGALLGVEFGAEEIERFLEGTNADWTRIDDEQALTGRVAELLVDGKVVGWFQGRMEFGPRALGSRSILADPRRPDMQQLVNQKVKFREGFRPFAPAVLEEHAAAHFELEPSQASPYMLLVAPVRDAAPAAADARGFAKLDQPRGQIPAVTHVDGSARVQTVDTERNPLFRRLLEAFHARTGCPLLVNTSFNLSWEPIVCTPQQAYDAFMTADLDALALGPFLLEKREQKAQIHVGEERRPERMLEDLLASPCCGAEMRTSPTELACSLCQRAFPIEEGIPRLFWPHETITDESDVTEKVKEFYEETPFPDYEEHDTLRSLVDKSRRGGYARLLDEAIPYNSSVLEGRGLWLAPYLRRYGVGKAKERSWFADQYLHPHESRHTMGEVQGWFERTGVDFVRGVPSVNFGRDPVTEVGVFAPEPPGTKLDRFLVQAVEFARGSWEGGFFIMIARKPEA
jgi:carbamoyltransferase